MEVKDETGDIYFFNRLSGRTQKERPFVLSLVDENGGEEGATADSLPAHEFSIRAARSVRVAPSEFDYGDLEDMVRPSAVAGVNENTGR